MEIQPYDYAEEIRDYRHFVRGSLMLVVALLGTQVSHGGNWRFKVEFQCFA
jgi:hypothetical protein